MSDTATHKIGGITYDVAAHADSGNISVGYEYAGQAVSSWVEIGFSKEQIGIMEDRSNGDIHTVVSKIGDAIRFSSKGSIIGLDDTVSRIDESATYKNAEEFREKQPRIASVINNALAATKAVSDKLTFTAAQKEMLRAYTDIYSNKETAR